MAFVNYIVTTKGQELFAKTLNSKTFAFTKFKVGSGTAPTTEEAIKALEDLVNPIMPVAITSEQIITNIQFVVKGLFKNTQAPSNFYFKEIGLYATDPDTQAEVLCLYTYWDDDNPRYIVNTISQIYNIGLEIPIKIDNANNVTIQIDSTTVYVTQVELEQAINKALRKDGKIYGIKRQIGISSSAWTRIEDSVGLVANATKDGTAVVNDFDKIYPWSDIISYNYDVKGEKVTAYYGEPTFKFDGSNGEVMTRFPEFWYKREQKDGYEYIYIADYEADGFIKSEQFSLSRYTASGTTSRLNSKSGETPLNNVTPANFRSYAKALGNGWGLLDVWHWSILQLLYLVEYADYNSQTKLGKGVVSKEWTGSFNGVNSGGCDSLGMKSGTLNDDGQHSMIYRGIEDILGNMWQICDGINIQDCQAYVCYDSEDYAFDVFNGSYHKLGYANSRDSGQYTKKLGYDANNPLLQLPIEGNGSSDTYITDYYWCTAEANANRVVWVGGYWNFGLCCGLWCWYCNNASSYTTVNHACRLLLNQ